MSNKVYKVQGGGYAAPLGQAPLGVIRPPQVNINVPNPMDVTNLYRMQQGIQNNLGIAQNQQKLLQNQQQLDLQNYELLLKESEQILGLIEGGVDSLMARHQSGKQNNSSSLGGMFGYLDPTKTEHKRLIDKYYDEYSAMTAQLTKLGQGYLSSGARNPADRLEIAHQISSAKSDFYQRLMSDKEFVEQNQAALAYDGYLQEIERKRAEEGYSVDVEEFNRVTKKYEDFVNGNESYAPDGTRIKAKPPSFTEYDPNRTVYKPADGLAVITSAVQELQKGVESSELIELPDGQRIEQKSVQYLDDDQLNQAVIDYVKDNPNIVKLFRNTMAGQINSQTGQPITIEEWITAQVRAIGGINPNAGRTVVTDYGPTVVKPLDSASASKKDGTDVNGNWFDISTDEGRRKNDLAESIYDNGYKVDDKDKFIISKIASDTERYDIIYREEEDDEGRKTPKAEVYVYQVDDKGKRTYTDGVPNLAQDEPIYTFERRPADVKTEGSINKDIGSILSNEKFNPTGQRSNDIKDRISNIESNGNYQVINGESAPGVGTPSGTSSAVGKYQFIWSEHGDDIKKITGLKPVRITPEDRKRFNKNPEFKNYSDTELGYVKAFLESPQAQEEYFDYINESFYQPNVQELNREFPSIDEDIFEYMLHYMGTPDTVRTFLTRGKHIVNGKDHTKETMNALLGFGRENNIDVASQLKDHFNIENSSEPMIIQNPLTGEQIQVSPGNWKSSETTLQGKPKGSGKASSGITW